MSFASLNVPEIEGVVQRFSSSPQVTLVVGAGASMEASLPSWSVLIERLLGRVAITNAALTDDDARGEWVRRTLAREDLLAAGAIVEVLAQDDLATLLPQELYGDEGAGTFEPGPTAHQVAYLRRCFGARATLLTTNYDDLLERALLAAGYSKRDVRSYVRRRKVPSSAIPVTHLHGFAGREGAPTSLVLTEEQYHRMQRGTSWQEQCVTEALETTSCLFVGTSLTDPNLIRYLYGYKQSQSRAHAAVFVRQGDAEGADDEVRVAREDAAAKRWGRCGVEAVFVDHYADAAQLVYEIAHRSEAGAAYVPVAIRAERALSRIAEVALLQHAPQEAFADRQIALSKWLRETLRATLGAAVGAVLPTDEPLALALWMLSPDGWRITGWAHSDRAHQDPTTMESIPIQADSTWAAVRAVCQGVRVEHEPQSDISRWRFVRAIPLVLSDPTRLPIGCLTIASTRPRSETILATMSSESQAILHRGLVDAVLPAFTRVASAA
jgi:SIR2-like protein